MPADFHALGGPNTSKIIPILVAGVIIVLRNSRARKLKVERLWLFPALYVLMLGLAAYAAPPVLTPVTVAVLAAALLLGAGLGWQRGRLIRIDVNPETHEMTAQASMIGVLFILGVMLARFGLSLFLGDGASLIGVPAIALADGLVLLAVAMLTTQRIEIWIRATKLLEEARARKAAPPGAAPPHQPPLVG